MLKLETFYLLAPRERRDLTYPYVPQASPRKSFWKLKKIINSNKSIQNEKRINFMHCSLSLKLSFSTTYMINPQKILYLNFKDKQILSRIVVWRNVCHFSYKVRFRSGLEFLQTTCTLYPWLTSPIEMLKGWKFVFFTKLHYEPRYLRTNSYYLYSTD